MSGKTKAFRNISSPFLSGRLSASQTLSRNCCLISVRVTWTESARRTSRISKSGNSFPTCEFPCSPVSVIHCQTVCDWLLSLSMWGIIVSCVCVCFRSVEWSSALWYGRVTVSPPVLLDRRRKSLQKWFKGEFMQSTTDQTHLNALPHTSFVQIYTLVLTSQNKRKCCLRLMPHHHVTVTWSLSGVT